MDVPQAQDLAAAALWPEFHNTYIKKCFPCDPGHKFLFSAPGTIVGCNTCEGIGVILSREVGSLGKGETIMKILFTLLGCGLMLLAICAGGNFMAFVNLPSVAIVIAGAIFFSLAHHRFDDITEAFQNALSSDASQNSQKDIAVFATLRKTTYGSGVAGTLIGLIQMLQSLDDPRSIGPAMAVALLTALYSVVLVEFLIDPMVNRILAKNGAGPQEPLQMAPGQSAHAVGMVFSALFCFFILLIAMK